MNNKINTLRSVKEALDSVDKKELKGKFADRDDKDLDNDGDADDSDEYLHKRRKAVSKAVKESVENLDEANAGGRIKLHVRNARQHLKDIESALTQFEKKPSPDWGDVGSLNYLTSQLGELADRVSQRGEFAKNSGSVSSR